MGWSCAIIYLQIWNFFGKVGLVSLAPLLVAVYTVGFATAGIPQLVRSFHPGSTWVNAGIVGLFLLLIANQAIWSQWPVDHGLYHMQTVKWLSNYAIVPAWQLAPPPGIQQFLVSVCRPIESWIWNGLAFYVANTLLVFALGLRSLMD